MTTLFEKQLKKEAEKIRLKARERLLLRDHIVSFMEYHPMASHARTVSTVPARKEVFSYFRINSWKFGASASALLVMLVVGVSTAAEYTAPGDILYPVKVRVNEEVLSQLSLSPYERVAWETRRVERRIAEARLLAKEGKLTDEVEKQITGAVIEHAESAKRGLAEMREDDADDAAVAQVVLESALDVQTAVLANEEATRNDDNDTIRKLANAVKDTKDTLTAEQGTPTLNSYDRFLARIEESTTRAHELFISISDSASDEERTDIQRRLDDIGRQIALAGEQQQNASSTDESIETLRDTLRSVQKLIAYMTDIDVRLSVELETLVPKRLTRDERGDRVKEGREELSQAYMTASERIGSSTGSVSEKVALGLEELEDALVAIDITLSEGELEAAEKALAAGKAMARDLLILTDTNPVPEVEPAPEAPTDASSTTPEVTGTSTPEEEPIIE